MTSTDRQLNPSDDAPLALVTGGAGFIGSHLVTLLLGQGWRVRVLDNFSTGRVENLPSRSNRLEILTGDIRDEAAVAQGCTDAEAVFHLAALVSIKQCLETPELAKEINVTGTKRVFVEACKARVRRVVFSSSCAVYGTAAAGVQHEGLPPAPASPYAASKLAGEQFAAELQGLHTTFACLRYFNVYGPGQRAESDYAAVIPRFIAAARERRPAVIYGDGEQTRDFVYVADVAMANLLAARLRAPLPASALFNIGTGRAASVNSLWQHIAAEFANPPEPIRQPGRPGEVRFSLADISRARAGLGFSAATDLVAGLRATAKLIPHIPAQS